VGIQIAQKEGVLALYKGLGAVVAGIVPKMAIRFSSFELYKGWLADSTTGQTTSAGIFIGGFQTWTFPGKKEAYRTMKVQPVWERVLRNRSLL
jgi:solute carrier family 25 citrate transporter 1